jgi:hypothetical protein
MKENTAYLILGDRIEELGIAFGSTLTVLGKVAYDIDTKEFLIENPMALFADKANFFKQRFWEIKLFKLALISTAIIIAGFFIYWRIDERRNKKRE